MENDPDLLPVSLIRCPDAGALLAAALPVLGARYWGGTSDVLARLGVVDPAVAGDAPHVGRPDDDDAANGWDHGFVQPDGPMRLSVSIACALTAWTCARRFGGTEVVTSGRRRGGSVERTMARQIAEAVRTDLGCGSWSAVEDEPGATAAIRTLTVTLDGAPLPMIRVSLTGASATKVTSSVSPSAWVEQLRRLGREVRLPVRTVLARPVLSAGEVARLAVGDVIPIRTPDRVALLSGRHKLAFGSLAECDGHAAVRLDPGMEVQ